MPLYVFLSLSALSPSICVAISSGTNFNQFFYSLLLFSPGAKDPMIFSKGFIRSLSLLATFFSRMLIIKLLKPFSFSTPSCLWNGSFARCSLLLFQNAAQGNVSVVFLFFFTFVSLFLHKVISFQWPCRCMRSFKTISRIPPTTKLFEIQTLIHKKARNMYLFLHSLTFLGTFLFYGFIKI